MREEDSTLARCPFQHGADISTGQARVLTRTINVRATDTGTRSPLVATPANCPPSLPGPIIPGAIWRVSSHRYFRVVADEQAQRPVVGRIPQPNLPVPLEMDRDAVIRVPGTRVTLDTVISAFDRGATPEEMVSQYPTVPLPDVYTLLAYYLSHREEVKAYLDRRRKQATQVRAENERRFPPHGVRERLMARHQR